MSDDLLTFEERRSAYAPEYLPELDRRILERLARAFKAVNRRIVRRSAERKRVETATPDEIMAEEGITFEERPRLYLAYDREARYLAGIMTTGRGRPRPGRRRS